MTNEQHIRAYLTGTRELCELIKEMMGENRVTLLSPVLRQLAWNQAEKVLAMHHHFARHLEVPSFVDIDALGKEPKPPAPEPEEESRG